MFTKLVIFAAALIVVGPVFAAGNSGGGSSAPSSASSSGSSGGGSHGDGGGHTGGGGGHSGDGGSHGGGGGGRSGGGGLAARGAAASLGNAHGSWHAGASHGAKPTAGQHLAMEHAPAKMAGTDHHHLPHFHRREPRWGDTFPTCVPAQDPFDPWNKCYSPSKSTVGNGTNRRS